MTTSASGKRTRVRKSASCSFGGPSGRPGKERLKLAPEGQLRVFAFEAAGERTGTTIDAAVHLLRLQLLQQPHRRDLALVLVAVVAGEDEHRRAVAVRDRGDVDERARPAGGVRDPREREVPDLLARRREVDRAGDRGVARHRIGHARDSRYRRDGALGRLEQPVDVVVGVRVGEVAALQVQRQLEDAVLHQLAAVAGEEVDVVPEQVVVADDRALEEVADEDRAEARRRRRGRPSGRTAPAAPSARARRAGRRARARARARASRSSRARRRSWRGGR